MDADDELARAEVTLAEGRLTQARRLLDSVLAREPGHEEARRLREALDDAVLRRHFPPRPPVGVIVLSILLVANGALTTLAGVGLMRGGALVGFAFLPLGVGLVAAGAGLWRLRGWAWTLAVMLGAADIVLGAADAARGEPASLFRVAFQALAVAYLFGVRRLFARRAQT